MKFSRVKIHGSRSQRNGTSTFVAARVTWITGRPLPEARGAVGRASGPQALMKEVEDIATAAGASRQCRPDPFAPAMARFAASSLRYPTIDHHKPDCLLRKIVRRLDVRRGDELEVGLASLAKAFGQIPRLP